MRYAIVTETYPPEVNGVALTVQGLELGLRARGHRVDLVRPRQAADGDGGAHEMLVRGMPLPRYPGLRLGLPATARLAAQWRHSRPDAVYVATEGPLGWSALRAARRLGIPAATGFHTRFDHYMRDYGFGLLSGAALGWMRRFHNRADATLVPTRELLALLQASGFARPVRLPRAVDTRAFDPARRDPALRAQWGVGEQGFAAIYVGRIAAEKNLNLAVRAFRRLQRERADARFVWVGDGPARAQLQAAHPDFIFCGVQRSADLPRHFASGDLFLFPSHSETFGNVTLEAMASGVPTVAFDYGAAREHLRDGLHGAAIADGDDAGFIAAAARIAGDEAGRAAMSRA
ncbi:glycosyltransferase family 1 protein, partial [Lysobacter sp. D1-1-M9]